MRETNELNEIKKTLDELKKDYSKTKKHNRQLGITLIALIVTMIVMLIIAGIIVAQLSGNGLFDRTKIAKQKYKEAQDIEDSILSGYENATLNGEIASTRDGVDAPVGTIISYMGVEEHKPAGYVVCDGSKYPIDGEYASLANHIETNFGDKYYFGGNATEGFAVPNLTGKFLKGNTSEKVGNNEDAGLPNITGTLYAHCWGLSGGSGAFSVSSSNTIVPAGQGGGTGNLNGNFNASRCSAIYGKSSTVTPENISVLYCIKY